MASQSSVLVEYRQQFESLRRALDHRCRDGMVEHHHGIVRHVLQEFIERQDLRPVRVLSPGRFGVNGGNGSL